MSPSSSLFSLLLSLDFSLFFFLIYRSGLRCSTQFMHIESWFYFHCFAAGFCFIATKVTRLTEKTTISKNIRYVWVSARRRCCWFIFFFSSWGYDSWLGIQAKKKQRKRSVQLMLVWYFKWFFFIFFDFLSVLLSFRTLVRVAMNYSFLFFCSWLLFFFFNSRHSIAKAAYL